MRTASFMTAIYIGTFILMGSASATEVQYGCADGTRLMVVFSASSIGPGSARLIVSGSSTETILPQVLSADGGRYADESTELWIKGDGARLTRAGVTTTCGAISGHKR